MRVLGERNFIPELLALVAAETSPQVAEAVTIEQQKQTVVKWLEKFPYRAGYVFSQATVVSNDWETGNYTARTKGFLVLHDPATNNDRRFPFEATLKARTMEVTGWSIDY